MAASEKSWAWIKAFNESLVEEFGKEGVDDGIEVTRPSLEEERRAAAEGNDLDQEEAKLVIEWMIGYAGRRRYQEFIERRKNDPAVVKLCKNEALTPEDQAELNAMWAEVEPEWPRDIIVNSLLRQLFGMDPESVQRAIYSVFKGGLLTEPQATMVDLIIDILVKSGYLPPDRLSEPPFTFHHRRGVRGVVSKKEYGRLVEVLEGIHRNVICHITAH